MFRSGMDLRMNSLHSSHDILTITCGLYCFHPYGNTIVIAFCNVIVVVYAVNTKATLLTMCAVVAGSYTDELTDTDNMRTTLRITAGHVSDDKLCISVSCSRHMQYVIYMSG